MKTRSYSFLTFAITCTITPLAAASPRLLMSWNAPVDVQIDFADAERILVRPQAGGASLVELETGAVVSSYSSLDPECRGVFAYPFLVSKGATCYSNESSHEIQFVSNNSLPDNNFSIAFLSEDSDASYFLINGRPFDALGYLLVKSVSKHDRRVVVRTLLSDLPGYSGAMSPDPHTGNFVVTIWDGGNRAFDLNSSHLQKLIQTGGLAKFDDIAKLTAGPFSGLSLDMAIGSDRYIYLNNTFGNYTVMRGGHSGQAVKVSQDCDVKGAHGSDWLLLCKKQELYAVPMGDL